VDLTSIATELYKISQNKVLRDTRPGIVEYATKMADRLMDRKTYTPEETQDVIKLFNSELESFYRNPS
jgi:hypothetical protein